MGNNEEYESDYQKKQEQQIDSDSGLTEVNKAGKTDKTDQDNEEYYMIEDLVKAIDEGKVVIFIGPQFAEANGYPRYIDFFDKLITERFPLERENDDNLKNWIPQNDYMRVAEWCSRKNLDISFEYRIPRDPGILYNLIFKIPSKAIVTANIDVILRNQQPLNENFKCFKPRDSKEIAELLDKEEFHIFYALGIANDPEKLLIRYEKFKKYLEDKNLSKYYSDLFEKYIPFFIGFEEDDPFLKFLLEKIPKDIDENKLPFAFFAHGLKSDLNYKLKIIKSSKDTTSSQIEQDNAFFILEKYRNFLSQIIEKIKSKVPLKLIPLDRPEEDIWNELTEELEEAEAEDATPDNFFFGGRPSWGVAVKNLDARRDIEPEIEDFLLLQELGVALITAPSGCGKSSLCHRIAYNLWKEYEFRVFRVDDPRRFPKRLIEEINKCDKQDQDVLVFIDRAQDLTDFHFRVKEWKDKGFQRLRFLIAGRSHEIRAGAINIDQVRKTVRFQNFELNELSSTEAERIVKKLAEHNCLEGLANIPKGQRGEYFRASGKRDLLASLLTSTRGKDLKNIVADVCKKVSSWPDGMFLLKIYAMVAAFNKLEVDFTRKLFLAVVCSDNIKDSEQDQIYDRLLDRLPGELSLSMGSMHIKTRHNAISEAAFECLFDSEKGFFKELDIYREIFEAAGRFGEGHERNLTTIIPKKFERLKNFDMARKLFKKASKAVPNDPVIWQAWALLEDKAGNQDEAINLLKKATEAGPKNASSWQAWGLLEDRAGRIEEARRLLKKATEADPKHAPSWQAWGLLEDRAGRIEEAIRLLKKATEADPKNAPSWQAWGLLEDRAGRIEEAKKLFKRATEADPKNAPSWYAWGLLEDRAGRIEEARRLLQKATEADPKNAPSWYAWGLLEKKEGNIDKACELIEKGLKVAPDDRLLKNALDDIYNIDTPKEEGAEGAQKKEVSEETPKKEVSEETPKEKIAEYKVFAKWPFIHRWITEGLSFDDTRTIEYMLQGLAEILGVSVTIAELRDKSLFSLYPVDWTANYPELCKCFFKDKALKKLEDHPCLCDMKERINSIYNQFKETKDYKKPIVEKCKLGFYSLYIPIMRQERIMGMFIIGKVDLNNYHSQELLKKRRERLEQLLVLSPKSECLKSAEELINKMESESYNKKEVANTEKNRDYIDDDIENQEQDQYDPLVKNIKTEKDLRYFFDQYVKENIKRVKKVIEILHLEKSKIKEEEFAEELTKTFALPIKQESSPEQIREIIDNTLKALMDFINTKFVGLFLGLAPRDRYIQLISLVQKNDISENRLPSIYMDREKAKIPDEIIDQNAWFYPAHTTDVRESLEGPDAANMAENLRMLIPFSRLGHVGGIIIGPLNYIGTDDQFNSLTRIVFDLGLQLIGLYLLKSYHRLREFELLGYSLHVHSLRSTEHQNLNIINYLERFFNKQPEIGITQWQQAKKLIKPLADNHKRLSVEVAEGLEGGGAAAQLHIIREDQENKVTGFEPVSSSILTAIVKNVVDEFESIAKARQMKIEIDQTGEDRTEIEEWEDLLRKLINTLISNAIYHGKEKTEINIKWYLQDRNNVKIEVRGIGSRISDEQRANMFMSPGKKEQVLSGNHLHGLHLVKKVTDELNCEVEVISKECNPYESNYQEHTFWFTYPCKNKEE